MSNVGFTSEANSVVPDFTNEVKSKKALDESEWGFPIQKVVKTRYKKPMDYASVLSSVPLAEYERPVEYDQCLDRPRSDRPREDRPREARPQPYVQRSSDDVLKTLVKTKVCRNVLVHGSCKRENCSFAHNENEFLLANCMFDNSCRYLSPNADRVCQFKHSCESVQEYYERTGKQAPSFAREESVKPVLKRLHKSHN